MPRNKIAAGAKSGNAKVIFPCFQCGGDILITSSQWWALNRNSEFQVYCKPCAKRQQVGSAGPR